LLQIGGKRGRQHIGQLFSMQRVPSTNLYYLVVRRQKSFPQYSGNISCTNDDYSQVD
jgi:hypothetical protein